MEKETRFFGISRKELKEFYLISKRYGLHIYGDLEQSALTIPVFQEREINKKIIKIVKPFVFAGLPTSGKSTLINILHYITGKKITSYDLIKEMRKGQLCRKFNVKKTEFKQNFNKLMEGVFTGSYREWMTEIFKETIIESIKNGTLLDIGGYNLLREKEHLFLKENKVKIIYIDVGREAWLTNSFKLASERPDFKDIYEQDVTDKKIVYRKFCEETYDFKGGVCKSRSDIIIERKQLNPLELLVKTINRLNVHDKSIIELISK